MPCFGHNKTETWLGTQRTDFTLSRLGKLLPWEELLWHSLGNLSAMCGLQETPATTHGANISCNLLAKNGLLVTGLRQEHRLQHVAT